ncbi:hypothetical protein HO173_009900 [Letharia columbiana]|uniref:Uncharacterized protein n=1 Tax=Letharia columbiana TaxID=112416 RepID=A0A8H6FNJ8_9LECA|nr:uncharacterized protein HO173_009900 [Letharia columbiana]KAF6231817.1 hypothetical protein HO173_009900 [Letharia columbiana]
MAVGAHDAISIGLKDDRHLSRFGYRDMAEQAQLFSVNFSGNSPNRHPSALLRNTSTPHLKTAVDNLRLSQL